MSLITLKIVMYSSFHPNYNNLILLRFSYIEEDDLLRFMIKEEVDLVLPLIEGGETGKITRNAFTEWVVMFFKHLSKIYGFIPC